MRIDADREIDVTQVSAPDRVLQGQRHAALFVKTVNSVRECTITTTGQAAKEQR